MSARAIHRDAPVSPRKARLVADMIRRKRVEEAQDILEFNPQRAAYLIRRLLRSAAANAAELNANENWRGGEELDESNLYVKRITVDASRRLKRMRPRARGTANSILRRRCHITLELDDR